MTRYDVISPDGVSLKVEAKPSHNKQERGGKVVSKGGDVLQDVLYVLQHQTLLYIMHTEWSSEVNKVSLLL